MEKPVYNEYAAYLKNLFKEKVYKLPVNLPLTCPNRDGTKGRGGCIFCSEEGGSFENLENCLSVTEQLIKNKEYIGSRYNAKKFIAYFQSFTNTYLPLEDFKSNIKEAIEVSDIIGISISTRPDVVPEEFLEYLSTLKDDYFITIELGLQSVNNKTLEKINRGHNLSDFIDAALRIKRAGLRVCVHLIPNLPWDDVEDVREAANILSILEVDEVKLHSLYITEGTVMGEMYKNNEFTIGTKDDYINRVMEFLVFLREDILIQRLLGRAPEENSLFTNWDTSWWKIRDEIIDRMKNNNLYQGKYCKFK